MIDKQPQLQYLDMDAANVHCTRGLGIWEWASIDDGKDPDVVMACAGDIPTQETIAAAWLLRQHVPDLRVRVVNVVDLMRLFPADDHPHGMDGLEFNDYFTRTAMSSSRSTATPGPSMSWCTATRTPTDSMSAATSKRAPPRRRSTWSYSTT